MATTIKTSSVSDLIPTTTTTTQLTLGCSLSLSLSLYALKAPATKEKYIQVD